MGERRSRGGVFWVLFIYPALPKGDGGKYILKYFENKIYIFQNPEIPKGYIIFYTCFL
jgi:hypothetical protein